MKCTLCRLLPKEHSFKVCRWSTCDCGCFMSYLYRGKNRQLATMRCNTPEWLNVGVKEMKTIKIPKTYSDYMYALWNVSRGIPFRKDSVPAYWRDLEPKKKVFNWKKIVGLQGR